MDTFIDLKVTPSSGKQQLHRDKSGIIKCMLKSPPERGKANQELILFLTKLWKLRPGNIEIIRGLTDRKKTIKISSPYSEDELLALAGIGIQKSII